MTTQKAQTPIAKAVIVIFKCEKCGKEFERTVPIQVRNHKTGTITISAVLYPKIVMCNDCHKKEFEADEHMEVSA